MSKISIILCAMAIMTSALAFAEDSFELMVNPNVITSDSRATSYVTLKTNLLWDPVWKLKCSIGDVCSPSESTDAITYPNDKGEVMAKLDSAIFPTATTNERGKQMLEISLTCCWFDEEPVSREDTPLESGTATVFVLPLRVLDE